MALPQPCQPSIITGHKLLLTLGTMDAILLQMALDALTRNGLILTRPHLLQQRRRAGLLEAHVEYRTDEIAVCLIRPGEPFGPSAVAFVLLFAASTSATAAAVSIIVVIAVIAAAIAGSFASTAAAGCRVRCGIVVVVVVVVAAGVDTVHTGRR